MDTIGSVLEEETNPVHSADTAVISIGATLRAAREKTCVKSIEQISDDICLRPRQIAALESDQFDQLPGANYVVRFIRAYANYLSLDADELCRRYNDETGTPAEQLPQYVLEPAEVRRVPWWIPGVAATFLLVGTYSVWVAVNNVSEQDLVARASLSTALSKSVAVPENPVLRAQMASREQSRIDFRSFEPDKVNVPATLSSASSMGLSPAVTASKTSFHLGRSAGGTLILRAREDSYVRLVGSDNEVLVDRVMHAGDEFRAPNTQNLALMTGNAGVLDIFVNGVKLAPVGRDGAVLTRLSLDRMGTGASPALRIQ